MARRRHLIMPMTVAIAIAAGCSFDLFHSTSWNTSCDDDPLHCRASSSTGAGADGGSPCPAGQTECSTGCVDLETDGTNCGSCDHACTSGQVCSSAKCSAGCPTGTMQCGSSCLDVKTDPLHCGGCTTACDAGGICDNGQCARPASCKAALAADPKAPTGPTQLDSDGSGPAPVYDAYCDMTTTGGGWTLVLKLSGGDLCWGSANWTAMAPLNEAQTLDASLPAAGSPDAKSSAFYLVSDTSELWFHTSMGDVTTTFAGHKSPLTLITTNDVGFAAYPDHAAWRAAFGQDRGEAPIFMRAGVPLKDGNVCRTNPDETPHGCGQPCMFCYQASDDALGPIDCCPCAATLNDVSSGIGNSAAYCGAGQALCSTAGMWSNPGLVTLVWAR